jgi:predicted dehydrogenase
MARLFTQDEPIEIIARAKCFSSGADSTLGMLLQFPGDVQALIDCSFECPYRNRFEVVGTKGAIEFPDGVLPPEESTLVVRTAAGVETLRFPAADQYAEMLDCFARSIVARKLQPPAEDGVANMHVLEAVRNAARS